MRDHRSCRGGARPVGRHPRGDQRGDTGRRAGRARVAEPLRPGPQGLRRHRPQRRLEGVVHRRRRRALRRLRADHRQHERPHAAVRRHRRPQLHRPPEPRPDLHGQQRPLRHGVHGGGHQRRPRLHPHHPLRHRPGPRQRRHAHLRLGPPHQRAEGLRAPRRDRQRQRRWRQRQRRRRQRRRHRVRRPGRLRPDHGQPGEPTATTPCRPSWPSPPTAPEQASVGYADSASDGLTSLDATHACTPYSSAPNGHIVATEEVTPDTGTQAFTLALGFGRSQDAAVEHGPCLGRQGVRGHRAGLPRPGERTTRRSGSRTGSAPPRPARTGSAPTC